MGLFSKLRCEECGTESRWSINKFSNGYSEKLLCDDCLLKMHSKGFSKYCQRVGSNKVEYQKLFQYKAYYDTVVNNENYRYNSSDAKDLTAEDLLVFEVGGLRINKNFITISEYQDLVVETKDVFAITISPVIAFSGPLLGCIRIAFFTNNPLIPCFATIVDKMPSKLFNKATEFDAILHNALVGYCGNLKYRIDSPENLEELVMRDTNYSATMPKDKLIGLLRGVNIGIGIFDAESLYNASTSENNWDLPLHTDRGYVFIR